jgi:hypothetical protein
MTEHRKMRLAGEELSPLPDVSDSRLLQTLAQHLVPVIDGQAGNDNIVFAGLGDAFGERLLAEELVTSVCGHASS